MTESNKCSAEIALTPAPDETHGPTLSKTSKTLRVRLSWHDYIQKPGGVRADGGQRAGQGVLRRGFVAADSASTVVRDCYWFTHGRIPYTSRIGPELVPWMTEFIEALPVQSEKTYNLMA